MKTLNDVIFRAFKCHDTVLVRTGNSVEKKCMF
jgi:hypothetical protein